MRMQTWSVVIAIAALGGCDSGGFSFRDPSGGAADAPADRVSDGFDADAAIETRLDDAPDGTSEEIAAADGAVDTGLEVRLQPQPYIPARSFRFEFARRDGDTLEVQLIARDLGAVFGIALRVEWDPTVLSLADATMAPLFGEQQAVYRTAEVRPGSLALAGAFLGSKQETSLDGDVVVATLKLRVQAAGSSPLAFFEPRCLVLTRRLEKVDAVFLPATVAM